MMEGAAPAVPIFGPKSDYFSPNPYFSLERALIYLRKMLITRYL